MILRKSLFRICSLLLLGMVLSYYFLDRPLCELIERHPLRESLIASLQQWFPWMMDAAHGRLRGWAILVHWTALMGMISPIFIMTVPLLRPSRGRNLLLLMGVSLLTTFVLKNDLKDLFGRDWPISWDGNKTSWIRDHAYGFHFFGGGMFTGSDAAGSFPSGHAALAFAALLPLGMVFPRVLPWCLLGAVGEGILLILLNYHFLSDVLAGSLLGIFCTLASSRCLRLEASSEGSTPLSPKI
jgi:membrane-associated phospholipid phosphatase